MESGVAALSLAPSPVPPRFAAFDHDEPAADHAPVPAPQTLSVPPLGECHVWMVPARSRPAWTELLSDTERDRLAQLPVAEARNTFVTSRGAQRVIGSRYLSLPPAEIAISRLCENCAAQHGRPRILGSTIDYSISHTERWVTAAVVGGGGGGLVGIDIEGFDSCPDPEEVAPAALTPGEREHFANLPRCERVPWFFAAWTRKEAAMKLTGLGLAAAPDRLDVRGPVIAAHDVERWPDIPIHLRSIPAPHGHAASLATTVPVSAVRVFKLL
jgi:4'-phosphopantetheinyl transferase